jgi:hypothetical protein
MANFSQDGSPEGHHNSGHLQPFVTSIDLGQTIGNLARPRKTRQSTSSDGAAFEVHDAHKVGVVDLSVTVRRLNRDVNVCE